MIKKANIFKSLLFLAIISAGIAGCGLFNQNFQSPREKAARYLHRSDKAFLKKQYNKSIRLLECAMDIDTAKGKYLIRIAEIYHVQGNYSSALKYIARQRSLLQDQKPELAIKMLSREAGYALSHNLRRAAIKKYEEAIKRTDTYQMKDSLLLSSLWCNWGVAELFDEGYHYPCNDSLIGGCYLIHIRDIERAARRFERANSIHPEGCNPVAKKNLVLMNKILAIPAKTLEEYYGRIPVRWLDDISITHEEAACPKKDTIPSQDQSVGEMSKAIFKELKTYDEVLFVLDISGSMRKPATSSHPLSRIALMKKLVAEQITSADSTQRIGLLTVGGECNSRPTLVVATDTNNRTLLLQYLKNLVADGGTPLYHTLYNYSETLFTSSNNRKFILLASDGIDSCEKSQGVCELADYLCRLGIRLEVFSLLLDEQSNLNEFALYRCISEACKTPRHEINNQGEINTPEEIIDETLKSFYVTIEDLKTGEFTPQNIY